MKTGFNLRSTFQDMQIDYLASLRDEAILANYGIPVDAYTPKVENNLDEYINFNDKTKDQFRAVKTCIIPKFTEYRQILSREGNTAEENYTLECILPSGLHLPRNSRIILNEYDSNENKVAREWRVLSTVDKQLSNSKMYTRIAYLVPDRTSIMHTAKAEICECLLQINDLVKGEDYTIIDFVHAWYSTKVIYNAIDRHTDKDIDNKALGTCTVYWNVKYPSILY